MKMIAGVMKPDAGTIDYGVHVALTYYAQHQLEELHRGQHRVRGARPRGAGLDISARCAALLGAFLFDGRCR